MFLNAEVVGTHGGQHLNCVEISIEGQNAITINCDALGVSGGFDRPLGVTAHLGSRAAWSDALPLLCPTGCHRACWRRARRMACFRWPPALPKVPAPGLRWGVSPSPRPIAAKILKI